MPFDGLVTRKICEEYNEILINGKVDKIIEPSKDEIIFFIRNNRNTYKLLLSINAENARTNITNIDNIVNPTKPFNFCMVLRKYLLNARLISVVQIENDRILNFVFENSNELGDKEIKKIIIEIMGKHSNIILTTEKNTIIDSIKHVDFSMSSVREVMPGRKYILPSTQEKQNPFSISKNDFYNLIEKNHSLSDNFSGISSILNSSENLYNYENFINFINSSTPTLLYNKNENELKDFYFNALNYENFKSFSSISEVVDLFYSNKITCQKINARKNNLLSIVNLSINKVQKKINIAEEKIKTTSDMEDIRKKGELLQANIYKIEPYTDKITVEDYYNNNLPISIELDENLSASQNIQKIYKKYNKLKNTLIASTNQKNILLNELNYLESLSFEIQLASSLDELSDIESELISEGFIKIQKNKKEIVKSTYLKFLYTGFSIFVGKNNVQNDNLTFSVANKSDIWFHVKNAPGSHTILKTNNLQPPQDVLNFVASLAAFYSKLSNSPKVEVDFTTVKNVKKIPGAKPGMVIYENYKTLYVAPNDGSAFLSQ